MLLPGRFSEPDLQGRTRSRSVNVVGGIDVPTGEYICREKPGPAARKWSFALFGRGIHLRPPATLGGVNGSESERAFSAAF